MLIWVLRCGGWFWGIGVGVGFILVAVSLVGLLFVCD